MFYQNENTLLSLENKKIILGLKIKSFRKKLNLTAQELAKESGLSNSYLNEIEKGRKYPKKDKLLALADALKIKVEELTSLKLPKEYASFELLLKTNVLSELPLDLMGLDLNNIIDVLSNSPTKISAFLNTIIEIARNHDMETEYFYFSVLRSYQELEDNYFEEIEIQANNFRTTHNLPLNSKIESSVLKSLLVKQYNYKFDILPSDIQNVRSVYKNNTLYLNKDLNEHQLLFVLGREIAFNFMKLKPRPLVTTFFNGAGFSEIFNNFQASYFATALLLPKERMIEDLKDFFSKTKWSASLFEKMIDSLGVSAEMYMHRLTNILPTFFSLKSLFFLRLSKPKERDSFNITKELHLGRLHNPHAISKELHYCRRWVSVQSIKDLEAKMEKTNDVDTVVIDAQISDYYDSRDKYFIISVARPMYPVSGFSTSVSVGIYVDKIFNQKIAFAQDRDIKIKKVNENCEMCAIADCKQRAATASIYHRKQRVQQLNSNIQKFLKN